MIVSGESSGCYSYIFAKVLKKCDDLATVRWSQVYEIGLLKVVVGELKYGSVGLMVCRSSGLNLAPRLRSRFRLAKVPYRTW